MSDLAVTLPKTFENSVQAKMTFKESLEAPVKAGDEIGHIEIVSPCLKEPIVAPIYAATSVERAGVMMRLWQDLLNWISPKAPAAANPPAASAASTPAAASAPVAAAQAEKTDASIAKAKK
jgi:hypothetical protein